jgi:ubiquinone/menaquinone biosynthesis C-methylase UbiE
MSQSDQFWDNYWHGDNLTLTERTISRVMDLAKLRYLRGILPEKGGLTLEVGAGSARLSCHLAQLGYRTVGMDRSELAVPQARHNYASVGVTGEFLTGDAFCLPFADNSFDVVLSTGLLEHFEDPAPIVQEMARVLKPGGVFYSDIVPKKFSLFRSLDGLGKLKRRLLGQKHEGFYERGFNCEQIRAMMVEAGLVAPHVFPAGVAPPYLPLVYRIRALRTAQVWLVEKTQRFWWWLDGTRIAEWLGFYYFAWAVKPKKREP